MVNNPFEKMFDTQTDPITYNLCIACDILIIGSILNALSPAKRTDTTNFYNISTFHIYMKYQMEDGHRVNIVW